MTTPYRRGSSPSLIGASGASGASGSSGATAPFSDFPPAWNAQWVLKPPVGSATTVDLTAGPQLPESKIGASGASGGSRWNTKGGGASGSSGATGRPTGIDGVTSLKTDRISGLHNRSRNIVGAVYSDSMPMLSAWGNAGDALFNVLMAGFTSVEDFIETLVRILTGADVDLDFISEGARVFLEILKDIFGPIGAIFEWVWENIGEPILRGLLEGLKSIWDVFESIAESLGLDIQSIFQSIAQILGVGFEIFGNVIESILRPAAEFIKWGFEIFGAVIDAFVKPVINWLYGIWVAIGQPILTNIISWIAGAWQVIGQPALDFGLAIIAKLWEAFDTVVIDNIVELFASLTDNRNLLDFVEDIVAFFANVIEDAGSLAAGVPLFGDLAQLAASVISDVFETVGGWVLGIINTLTGGLFTVITDALGALITWATSIPGIGPLLSALIPDEWENAAGQKPASFVDLKEYAQETLNTSSVLYSANLQGQIPADLLPVVSPGFVGDDRPNLVADSGFRSAAAVQSGSGWSWDSSVSRTSGQGGSARVAGDGGVKQMFSNLIAVSPGQELECSVYARWTKPTAATPTISVGLRGYINDQVVFTQAVASRTNVAQNSASFAGNVGGWVEMKGSYTIPPSQSLTHVRLVLSVLDAPSGTSVWFDDAALRKVSLINQTLVAGVSPGSNLSDDIENAVGSEDYQALLDRVAKKTGASLADVQATIDDFLDGDSTISGDQIKAGNIASTYINELRGTWDTINTGVQGPGANADGTIGSAFAALDGWRTVISSHGGEILKAISISNDVNSRISRLETDYTKLRSYVQLMADDVRAVTIKNGLTPTTPAAPPGETPVNFASASDNFDRTTLGGAWSTAIRFNFAGAFLLDGNNAYFEAPAVTAVDTTGSAVYSTGSASEYQRVYASLGSAPGRPAFGGSGYNDLIGRAASPLACVVARFYANRSVRIFYRTGAWEPVPHNPSNTIGTFTLPSDLTSGSMIELFVGNKSISDQTKCFVKVGTWTSGTATLPASVLSTLGRGWGWGGGNGISGVVAQQSGRVNFWGAQDQT